MKSNHLFISISIVVIIFGTIITTSALGLWQTKSSKIPAKYQNGETKGEYNPADIKGSYTFGEISDIFKIPLDDLGNAFVVENKNDFSTFQCKNLEEIYLASKNAGQEVGTNSVRVFVALYKGLPIQLDNSTFFPETAQEILLNTGKLTDEQKAFVNSHLVKPEKSGNISSSQESGNTSFIKGKTTFKEVLELGVKKEDIETLINVEISDTSAVIKDFCSENELEFSKVKADIQVLIDKK